MTRHRAKQILIFISLAIGGIVGISHIVDAAQNVLVDIDIYRAAAEEIRNGASVYDSEGLVHGLPFLYPPFAAVLFVPFSFLGEVAVRILWTLILLGTLVAFARLTIQEAAPLIWRQYKWIGVGAVSGLAIVLEPIGANFFFGQINLVIALLVLADLTRRTGKLPAGVLLGVATALKLTPAIFIVYLLLTKRIRDGVVAIVTFLGCSAAGFIVAWSDSVSYWTDIAYDSSRIGVAYMTNQSFTGVFSRLSGSAENVTLAVTAVFALFGAIGLAIAVASARRNERMSGNLVCAVTALLVSPISWSHHWVWVLPVLVWLIVGTDQPKAVRYVGVLATALFIVSPIKFLTRGGDVEFDYSALEQLGATSYTLVAIAFIGWSAWRLRQPPRQEVP
jgi:alpha-1,2-mannosyltransferase